MYHVTAIDQWEERTTNNIQKRIVWYRWFVTPLWPKFFTLVFRETHIRKLQGSLSSNRKLQRSYNSGHQQDGCEAAVFIWLIFLHFLICIQFVLYLLRVRVVSFSNFPKKRSLTKSTENFYQVAIAGRCKRRFCFMIEVTILSRARPNYVNLANKNHSYLCSQKDLAKCSSF